MLSDNTLTKFHFAHPQIEAPYNVSYSSKVVVDEDPFKVLEGAVIVDNTEEAFNRFMRPDVLRRSSSEDDSHLDCDILFRDNSDGYSPTFNFAPYDHRDVDIDQFSTSEKGS